MRTSIGLDIGGTNISSVICDEQGRIVKALTRRTDYYGERYLDNIDEIIENLIKVNDNELCGIGIGVPGTVNYDTGNVRMCPALNWKDLNLREHIQSRFAVEAIVDNDVNVWTLAEKQSGAARTLDNFAMITIGTGIGCGLCLNGRIYRGYSFEAGEIGYLPLGIQAYEEAISESQFGFFESRASALAAGRMFEEVTNKTADCKEVFSLSKQGDLAAQRVVENIYKYLGLGISSLFCILNPQAVIIGGGMAKEGPEFLREVEKNVKRLIPLKTNLKLTQTGDFGGAAGSAMSLFLNKDSKDSVRTNVF